MGESAGIDFFVLIRVTLPPLAFPFFTSLESMPLRS